MHPDDRRVTANAPINDALGQREKENRRRVDDRVREKGTKARVRAENNRRDKSERGDAPKEVERETARRRKTTTGLVSEFGAESDVAGRRAGRTTEEEKTERERRDVREPGGEHRAEEAVQRFRVAGLLGRFRRAGVNAERR